MDELRSGGNGRGSYRLGRREFLAASALASAGLLLSGCRREAAQQAGGGGAGNFPETPEYNFVFVNHVTTNSFFVPTQYGIEDADALFGTKSQWTGSEKSDVQEMVDAMSTAVSGNADGIALSIIDPQAFNGPIQRALDKGIPVIAYNANGKEGQENPSLAYVGQDLFLSGVEMGKQIVDLVGDGPVALFIATPGSLNIQPRIDGAIRSIKDSGKPIEYKSIASGAELNEELSRIDAYYIGNKDVKGMFAVDAGSTQSVGQVIQKYKLREKGVKGGGYDTLPKTLELLQADQLDFTIDQQPYLQGFFPVMQLYLTKISGNLTGTGEMNTGLKFVTKDDAGTYSANPSRFEGSTKEQKVIRSGA